jgi:hypothetical protein
MTMEKIHRGPVLQQDNDKLSQMYESRKAKWLEAARNKPSLYQYLKDNVHGDDSNLNP